MVVLALNNKYEIAFAELVVAAERKGGVPKEFTISAQEARDILIEMAWVYTNNEKTKFRVTRVTSSPVCDLRSAIIKAPDDTEQLLEIINSWYQKDVEISFGTIPLRILRKEKPKIIPPPEV